MVYVTAVFIREEAEHAREETLTGILYLNMKLHFQHSINFPALSKTTTGSKKLFAHVITT